MGLAAVTKKLGTVYTRSKKADKELASAREQFYREATKQRSKEPLAQKTIRLEPGTLVEEHIEKFHPGWKLVKAWADGALIEEDPEFQKFVYVNRGQKMVYQRNVWQSNPALDDEALREQDPDLWERITEPGPLEVLLRQFGNWIRHDDGEEAVDEYLEKYPGLATRQLVDLKTLADKDLDALQEYFVPGRLNIRLEAPRKAKPDELDPA